MKIALAVLLTAGMAVAQVAPTTPGKVRDQLAPATPGAERPAPPPSQAVPSAPATGTVISPTKGGAVSASPFSAKKTPPQKSAAATSAKPSAKTAETKAKPSAAAAPAASATAKGRRDPFVSPVVRATGGETAAACTTGKRCLTAGEIVLRGVVKSQAGMIAVVENAQHRTYFLKENDPIFSGSVVKITGDSVVIRESTQDSMGRPSSRDVVKKVAPSA